MFLSLYHRHVFQLSIFSLANCCEHHMHRLPSSSSPHSPFLSAAHTLYKHMAEWLDAEGEPFLLLLLPPFDL